VDLGKLDRTKNRTEKRGPPCRSTSRKQKLVERWRGTVSQLTREDSERTVDIGFVQRTVSGTIPEQGKGSN
jgi:hypothetical protein